MSVVEGNPPGTEGSVPAGKSAEPAYATDAPLTSPKQDRLGRDVVAQKIAESILQLDASNGFVVGIQGPWGSGKSSLLNLINYHLDNRLPDRPVTMSFNPWWFASAHDLLTLFLREMSGAIRRSDSARALSKAADLIQGLATLTAAASVVVPWVGPQAAAAGLSARWLGGLLKRKSESRASDVDGTRAAIARELKAQQKRVVVFVDDLDRLSEAELKQMFAIVKAVAGFPNTVYVLGFHRDKVAAQFGEAGEGRSYLDKIVQMCVDLPRPTRSQMDELLAERLHTVVGAQVADEERDRFATVYVSGLLRLLRTPRDINRYTNALAFAYPALRQDVCVTDFLALECIRAVAPGLHGHIRDNLSLYAGSTESRSWEVVPKPEERRDAYENAMSGEPPENREPLLELMKLLFPKVSASYSGSGYGNDWLEDWVRNKRCCSPEVFPVYFSLLPPTGYFGEADYQSLMAVTDRAPEFEAALRRLAEERFHDATVTRMGAALDMLHTHDKEGFQPVDPYQALLALANLTGDADLPHDSRLGTAGGIPMNELRIWCLASDILSRSSDAAGLLSRVLTSTRSLYAAVDWVQSCETQVRGVNAGQLPPRDALLDETGLQQVISVAVAKLRSAPEDVSLLRHRRAMYILLNWQAWDETSARAFVERAANTDSGLVELLTAALRDVVTLEETSIRRGQLSKAMTGLSKLADLDWLKQRANQVLDSGLDLTEVQQCVLAEMANWEEGKS